ncbi:MAG TPA: hypothetical protein V6D14_02380 [Coleofasciculaceae cyanobacterium]
MALKCICTEYLLLAAAEPNNKQVSVSPTSGAGKSSTVLIVTAGFSTSIRETSYG